MIPIDCMSGRDDDSSATFLSSIVFYSNPGQWLSFSRVSNSGLKKSFLIDFGPSLKRVLFRSQYFNTDGVCDTFLRCSISGIEWIGGL